MKDTGYFSNLFRLLVIVLGLGLAWHARADGVGDARANLEKAYNDYYQALRARPGSTPQESTGLRNQLIAPAQKALHQAMLEQARKSTGGSKRKAHLNHGDFAGPVPQPSKGMVPRAEDADTSTAAKAEAHSTRSDSGAGERPKVILDGSRVPREVEFPAPKATGK